MFQKSHCKCATLVTSTQKFKTNYAVRAFVQPEMDFCAYCFWIDWNGWGLLKGYLIVPQHGAERNSMTFNPMSIKWTLCENLNTTLVKKSGFGVWEECSMARWLLAETWLGAVALSACQVHRNIEALKLQPYESAKSPGLRKPIPVPVLPRQWEQIGTTSGSHFTQSLQGER